MKQPLVIGLTGQIGSGKSTAGAFFKALGISVIDTDQLARDIVQPGTEAYQQIITYFGAEALQTDNTLNRHFLRTKIFHDPAAKTWLEQLTHPLIETALEQQLSHCQGLYVVVLIPLLINRPRLKCIERILVIESEQQQVRVLQRDNIDLALFQKILASQPTRQQLRHAADDCLLNNGSLEALQQQVEALHQRYLSLCNRVIQG